MPNHGVRTANFTFTVFEGMTGHIRVCRVTFKATPLISAKKCDAAIAYGLDDRSSTSERCTDISYRHQVESALRANQYISKEHSTISTIYNARSAKLTTYESSNVCYTLAVFRYA